MTSACFGHKVLAVRGVVDRSQPGHHSYASPSPPVSSSSEGHGSRLWGPVLAPTMTGHDLAKLPFISASFFWFTNWK